MLTLKWFGHAMWSVETDNYRIVIDPFTNIGYDMPTDLTADVVVSSHEHFDHNNFKLILPTFQKITQIGSYQLKKCKIKLIEASHGVLNEKSLGDIYMILIYIDGYTILHCGDLGVVPDEALLKEIGTIDILMIPVGGQYTINAEQAKETIDLLNPALVFPMHYKTEKCNIEIIDTIEPFVNLYPNIERIDSDVFEISENTLNKNKQRIIKLNYEKI